MCLLSCCVPEYLIPQPGKVQETLVFSCPFSWALQWSLREKSRPHPGVLQRNFFLLFFCFFEGKRFFVAEGAAAEGRCGVGKGARRGISGEPASVRAVAIHGISSRLGLGVHADVANNSLGIAGCIWVRALLSGDG
jgi:hypothetical protein